MRSWPVSASGNSEKHAETRKKQAKIALRLRGPAAPSLRKVAFFMQNVAKTPWYVPGVLLENHGFLGGSCVRANQPRIGDFRLLQILIERLSRFLCDFLFRIPFGVFRILLVASSMLGGRRAGMLTLYRGLSGFALCRA